MKLAAGQIYRCGNPVCECEILLREPPRPGAPPIPACCFCGTPMLISGA